MGEEGEEEGEERRMRRRVRKGGIEAGRRGESEKDCLSTLEQMNLFPPSGTFNNMFLDRSIQINHSPSLDVE